MALFAIRRLCRGRGNQLCEAHVGFQGLRPTACLDVTSVVASSYGHDNGRLGPTHCAFIDDALGDRCSEYWACRTPLSAAGSARSALAAALRPGSTAALGGSPRSRTRPRSGITPCGDASPARCAPGTHPADPAKSEAEWATSE